MWMDGWTDQRLDISLPEIFFWGWDLEGSVAHWQCERPGKCLAGIELDEDVGMGWDDRFFIWIFVCRSCEIIVLLAMRISSHLNA
jgi:hypothetical protein